jgi:hypothetical protein
LFLGGFHILLAFQWYNLWLRTSSPELSSSTIATHSDVALVPDPQKTQAQDVTETKHEDKDSLRVNMWSRVKRFTTGSFGGRALGRLKASDFPPPPPSPYEQRTPGKKLPLWASKPFYFRRRHLRNKNSHRICLVHVGKTAGSTVGCALGFQLHCRKNLLHPPGLLPSVVTNMLHSQINDCTLTEDHYLVTLRDPLERIKSWYSYEKLERLKTGECNFRSLNELALRGLTEDDPTTPSRCRRRAYRALTGKEQIGWHAYNNYEFYLKQLPLNASIAVIRSEHMLDDWNSLEGMLGSKARARAFPSKNKAKEDRKEPNKVLSTRARELVCAALCREIQVYKHYLRVAVNLQSAHVQQSLEELRRSCPKETDEESCPL